MRNLHLGAAGASDVHEEGVGALHKALELVGLGLLSSLGLEDVGVSTVRHLAKRRSKSRKKKRSEVLMQVNHNPFLWKTNNTRQEGGHTAAEKADQQKSAAVHALVVRNSEW